MQILMLTMMFNISSAFFIFCVFATSFAQENNSPCRSSIGHNGEIPKDNHHSCCGNITYNILESSCCNSKITPGLSQLMSDCCESTAYNPLNEICCKGHINTLTDAQAECCGSEVYVHTVHVCCVNGSITRDIHVKHGYKNPGVMHSNKASKDSKCTETNNVPVLKCGSKTYNPQTQTCCSGKLYKANPLFQCCGEKIYSLSQNVLCCNGILHTNLPKNSECVEGFIYTDGTIKMTCGSEIYDHYNKSLKCCSGHLYSNAENAECCGSLLVKRKDQTCCSSTLHTLPYKTKSNHSCCGHYYYNMSLWSCCAGHLKPTPEKHNSTEKYRLKPLTDLIPDMCNNAGVFGKVENVALDKNLRTVKIRIVKEDNSLSQGESVLVLLDHCSTPALESNMTYLWQKIKLKYKPLSFPIEAFDIHMFSTLCNSVRMKEKENE